MNIVPFEKKSADDAKIYLKCLPAGGFHHVKRVVHSGKNLRKCGYEKQCVLQSDQNYTVTTKEGKIGEFVPITWGPDNMEVVVKKSDEHDDYVDVEIKAADKDEEQNISIMLYESRIEAA